MGSSSFSDEAVKDIEDICDYLARDNPRAAGQLFDAIRQKCKLVANFPGMGKAYPRLADDLRGFVVEDYIVFYYPREGGITIARVVSGYRDLDFLFTGE